MSNFLRGYGVRVPIIAIAFASWLIISNHCALAAIEGKMPMPGCHGTSPWQQSPAPDHRNNGVECCKILRATLLTGPSNLSASDTLTFTPHDYADALTSAKDEGRRTPLNEWDTGPPRASSFAESVLQRSILAHAPPSPA